MNIASICFLSDRQYQMTVFKYTPALNKDYSIQLIAFIKFGVVNQVIVFKTNRHPHIYYSNDILKSVID